MEGCAKLAASRRTNDAASQRCWYNGRAEFVGEESQRDAGMTMLTTENTQPTNGGGVRADDIKTVSVGISTGTRDSFENVLTVVGKHVVVWVFDISIAQHCLSRLMGAVLFEPQSGGPS